MHIYYLIFTNDIVFFKPLQKGNCLTANTSEIFCQHREIP